MTTWWRRRTTRPDVAALASALHHTWFNGAYGYTDGEGAEAIIAALAAQGWRITSAPDYRAERDHYLAGCLCPQRAWCIPHGWAGTDPMHHRVCADHGHVNATANDPASAQAVPDYPQTSNSPARATVYSRTLIEHAAVRAALEGLRAEVAGYSVVRFSQVGAERSRILAAIDARLADLP